MRLHGAEYGLCLFGDIVGGGMSKIEYFFSSQNRCPVLHRRLNIQLRLCVVLDIRPMRPPSQVVSGRSD